MSPRADSLSASEIHLPEGKLMTYRNDRKEIAAMRAHRASAERVNVPRYGRKLAPIPAGDAASFTTDTIAPTESAAQYGARNV